MLTGVSLPIASLECCDWGNLVGMTAGNGQNSDDFPIFFKNTASTLTAHPNSKPEFGNEDCEPRFGAVARNRLARHQ
jgi:hypothetical protein